MQRYEEWMVRNNGLVGKFEWLAHQLFFLSPTRVRDSDFKTESLLTGVTLVSLYHEHVRHKHNISAERLGGIKLMMLRAIQAAEVMIEMGAIAVVGHTKSKWRCILAVEIVKMMLRFGILNERQGCMIIEQTAQDPGDFGSSKPALDPLQKMANKRFGESAQQVVGRRSGVMFRSKSKRTQPQAANKLTPELAAEILYILRPVAYLLLYLRFPKTSWTPWIIPLVMDLIQLQLHRDPKSSIEKEEMVRRRGNIAYYLLRDPIYAKFTRPLAAMLHLRLFNKIPLVNAISDLLLGIADSMNALHFYKACS